MPHQRSPYRTAYLHPLSQQVLEGLHAAGRVHQLCMPLLTVAHTLQQHVQALVPQRIVLMNVSIHMSAFV